MEKVVWKVEGMTCTNCALTINQYLQKKGSGDVKVNFIGGEVSFTLPSDGSKISLAPDFNLRVKNKVKVS